MLQYFLDHFWNFQNFLQSWTFSLLCYVEMPDKFKKIWNIIKHIIHTTTFWTSIFSRFFTLPDIKLLNLFVVCFSTSGGSKTIGFSERFQRILRWWNRDESLISPNLQNVTKAKIILKGADTI